MHVVLDGVGQNLVEQDAVGAAELVVGGLDAVGLRVEGREAEARGVVHGEPSTSSAMATAALADWSV